MTESVNIENICAILLHRFGGNIPYRYVDLTIECHTTMIFDAFRMKFSEKTTIFQFRHLKRLYIESMTIYPFFNNIVIRLCEMRPLD